MIVEVKKPQDEQEFVNLCGTVQEELHKVDKDLHSYFVNSANICDDCEFEEIIDMFKMYYAEVRDMNLEVISDTEEGWTVEILPR
jgi:hypothetical protein